MSKKDIPLIIGSSLLLIIIAVVALHTSNVDAEPQQNMVESASTTQIEIPFIATTTEDFFMGTTTDATTTLAAIVKEIPPVAQKKKLNTLSDIKFILSKIARCESENNPFARNTHSSAKGLLQIIDGTWETYNCPGNVLNADDNMACGIKIAQISGNFSSWNESKNCWIKLLPADLLDHAL